MLASRGLYGIVPTSSHVVMLLLCALMQPALGLGPARAQSAAPAPAEVAGLAGKHPALYYSQAAELLKSGRKDDAVFVFYLGQLRYRAHLMARPGLKPDGDPALFASFSETIGRALNEYAFGDIPRLARTIDDVLAYDTANPDLFNPPAQLGQGYESIRSGLQGLKEKMLREADDIRASRARNGLPNRN